MADKKFGVRQIDLIGTSGATNIETPNTLNLKSNQVAISTDLSIGGSIVSHVKVGTGFSVGIGTTIPKSALEVDGTARATYFIGNGSGLTGVTGTGAGIAISESGATVGTAQTINFIGAAVTFSAVRSGLVTCTITSGGTLDRNLNLGSFSATSAGSTVNSGGIVAGVSTFNNTNTSNLNVTGVSTFAGITTVTGTTLFTKQLNVSGVSTFVGVTTFSASINVGVDTSAGLILTASNGSQFRLIVEDDGSLSTVAI